MKVRACVPCTLGKRRCDRLQPACGRCIDRDVDCSYPPNKRKRSQISAADTEFVSQITVNETDNNGLVDLQEWTRSFGNLRTLLHGDSSSSTTASDYGDATHFFLKPDAWAIRHIPFTTPVFSNAICMNYVQGIHEFFSEWVANGHSSFMHRQLYADTGYPLVIQDAFACVTLYNVRTPANEDIIDAMISSKASALLGSYAQNNVLDLPPDLTIREHLARAQALYVHLVLSLFSSSIGARANAEQKIPILLSWIRQLWEAALLDPDICQSENSDVTVASTSAIVLDAMFDGDTTPRLWRSWVLSESIRRIWLMATSTIGVYLTLRQKWADCQGGIYFTARKDIWNAKSASSWAAACRSSDPLFLCSLEAESLFLTAKAPEVDDLLINLFTIMWGAERVENWFARTADSGQSVRVWRNSGPVEK
ncbi:hypothetical protein FLONG3_6408 [Fusarium longipes]|uniref:Zn(2)-C6 fungal-type domain-containing protein n=1 Tax=Fusarium longipes TaxID=694270 RepID=A0A395SKX2_9HYPO|nr:hypothetical protein FLONG3_6408 [Fusarium longipes]